MGSLQKIIRSDAGRLSNKAYFQSLVLEGKRVGLLTESDVEKIQLACLELLSEKIEQETVDYSSSVREEVAQNLLASICYTIGLALKQEANSDNAIISLREKSIQSLFQIGRLQIDAILCEIKTQYCKIQSLRCGFDNSFYDYAINKQPVSFLKKYNPDLSAHEAAFIPEYPVECPCNDLIGIEYVKAYADALYVENWFCSHFSQEEFSSLLLRYEELKEDTQCNIYHYTLLLALANLMVNHNLYRLQFTENDFVFLQSVLCNLSATEIDGLLLQSFEKYIQGKDFDPICVKYIKRSIQIIANEISIHIEANTLKNMFFSNKPKDSMFNVTINEDIGNSAYCDILQKIKLEQDISKQIELIKTYATSPSIFIELILDLWYTTKEIIKVLTALDDLSLSIIIKFCKIEQAFDYSCNNEKYQNFYDALEKMLSMLEAAHRIKIEKIVDNIQLVY